MAAKQPKQKLEATQPKTAKPKVKGRGNADSDLLYLGIRNIRRTTWDKLRAYAKEHESNSGTVISDACDAYLRGK